MNKNDEMILAVPALSLLNMVSPEGAEKEINRYGVFKQRGPLETNEEYKQIIPYVVLTHKKHYLRYRRPAAGGEGRLHGMYSLGFGGHVSSEDTESYGEKFDGVLKAAMREVLEELSVSTTSDDFKFASGIYCPEDAVGRVHYGLGFTCELSDSQVKAIRQSDEVELLGWLTKEELQICASSLEKWSRYVLFNSFGCI